MIWATDFEEEIVKTTESAGGGKGGSGGDATIRQYRYYANFAVALGEGVVTRIGRIWADEQEIDLSRITFRLHTGTETDSVDSLIAAREGADNAPAYRGVAYIVFERLPLADYGNRIPQLSFEVFRSVSDAGRDVRGVVMIPGAGEFVYATEPVHQTFGDGVSQSENVHQLLGATDWQVAIDQLEAALPNAKSVSLIVSWFGTDLRAGACQLKPGVETRHKSTGPLQWSVAGLTRDDAYVISARDGNAAYGGTPSDQTVIAAIRDLKARDINVTLTPFILMDVAEGNTLANPYGGTGQPAYPWRGRITCHPAPGNCRHARQDGDGRCANRNVCRHGIAREFLIRRRYGPLFRPRRMVVPAHGPAPGVSRQGGRRRRSLRYRHGIARADASPLERRRLSVRRGADRACR